MQYSFTLPPERVANRPASPRDAARLFVYDTRTDSVSFSTVRRLGDHVARGSLMVFNDTKVVPARVIAKKETGGAVELLLLVNEYRAGDKTIRGYADRRLRQGEVLSVPGSRFLVVGQDRQIFTFKHSLNAAALIRFLSRYGNTPTPKYLKHIPLREPALRRRYQSIFARRPASIAAPTASLHFTDRVFRSLAAGGVAKTFVTLSVGRGTFAPVTEAQQLSGTLHSEPYHVGRGAADLLRRATHEGRLVIAVGTTVARCLEAAAGRLEKGSGADIAGETDFFIRPPYRFKVCDGLFTNFHLPDSSLLMLVDAFLRHKKARRGVLALYRLAIAARFNFYSFGDAMLIL